MSISRSNGNKKRLIPYWTSIAVLFSIVLLSYIRFPLFLFPVFLIYMGVFIISFFFFSHNLFLIDNLKNPVDRFVSFLSIICIPPYRLCLDDGYSDKDYFLLQKKPARILLQVDSSSLAIVINELGDLEIFREGRYFLRKGITLLLTYGLLPRSIIHPAPQFHKLDEEKMDSYSALQIEIFYKISSHRKDWIQELSSLLYQNGSSGNMNALIEKELRILISSLESNIFASKTQNNKSTGNFQRRDNTWLLQLLENENQSARKLTPIQKFLISAIKSNSINIELLPLGFPTSIQTNRKTHHV